MKRGNKLIYFLSVFFVASLSGFKQQEQLFEKTPNVILIVTDDMGFGDLECYGGFPYHTPGIAHGLSFSVQSHTQRIPPSLKNIYRELSTDIGCRQPNNGCLEPWARQGVLMLNAVWTVRAHEPNSHRGRGWEFFTNRILEALDAKPTRVVFVLWGQEARKKQTLITNAHHVAITAAHPSPLSARKFFGCRCFSQINRALIEKSMTPIDWQIPDRD